MSAAPAGRRGQLIGSALGVAIGGAMFGPVAGALASVAGTGPVFAGIGGLCLVVAFVALKTPAPPPRPGQPIRRLGRALADSRILGGLLARRAARAPVRPAGSARPAEALRLGLGAVAIGAVYLVATCLEAVAAPLVGRLSDRRGRRLPVMVGLGASAVATAVLPWPEAAAALAVIAVFAALSFGISWSPAMSFISESAEQIGVDVAWGFALINLAWAPGRRWAHSAAGRSRARPPTRCRICCSARLAS